MRGQLEAFTPFDSAYFTCSLSALLRDVRYRSSLRTRRVYPWHESTDLQPRLAGILASESNMCSRPDTDKPVSNQSDICVRASIVVLCILDCKSVKASRGLSASSQQLSWRGSAVRRADPEITSRCCD